MAEGNIKKLYIIYILEVLRKYSDFNHRLTQKDIIEHIQHDYGVVLERKSVARNIGDLQDLEGIEIEYDGGYYLSEREFEDSELRLLIDSVLNSKYIPKGQAKMLIEKLIAQSNMYFRKSVKHYVNVERMEHTDGQLFYNIESLSEAIDRNRKVAFYYNRYDENKKLVHTTAEKHLVNPYQIAIANGKYYLIGNIDKYSNSSHFRVERITDIEILNDVAKPIKDVDEFRNGLDLPTHMAEHIYMFSGKSERVKLKVEKSGIDDCIDWLGKDIELTKNEDGTYMVEIRANPQAMKYWAVQFGSRVELIAPDYLRQETAELIKSISGKYE